MGRERDRGPVETYKEREREREVLKKEGGTRDIGGERHRERERERGTRDIE